MATPARTPRVLLVRASVADAPRADALGLAILEGLRGRGWPVRRPEPATTPPAEGDTLAAAREAYDQLRPDEARAILDSLRARLARSGGAGLDEAGLRTFWLLDALVGAALGDPERMRQALTRIRVAFPSFRPDPRLYPPSIAEGLAEVPVEPAAALVEVATVDEALVWVDGRPLPPGERRVRLAPGTHLFRAAAGGFGPAGREVAVDAGDGGNVVELPLAPDDEARLRRPGPPGAPIALRVEEAAARLGVGLVLLEVAAPDALRSDDAPTVASPEARLAVLTDRTTGQRGRIVLDPSTAPGVQGARLLRAFLASPGPADASADGASRDLVPWVVGGAVGAAAVLAVVLAVVLTQGDDGAPPQGFRLRWEGP